MVELLGAPRNLSAIALLTLLMVPRVVLLVVDDLWVYGTLDLVV